jgi:hypothetical protein
VWFDNALQHVKRFPEVTDSHYAKVHQSRHGYKFLQDDVIAAPSPGPADIEYHEVLRNAIDVLMDRWQQYALPELELNGMSIVKHILTSAMVDGVAAYIQCSLL